MPQACLEKNAMGKSGPIHAIKIIIAVSIMLGPSSAYRCSKTKKAGH